MEQTAFDFVGESPVKTKSNAFGPNNPNWKGGRSVASSGYVIVRVGKDHHLADVRGYAYEHRLVAEQKLGRRLEKGEIPHHINGDRQDNRPENIQVMKSAAHHQNQHRGKNSNRKLADEANPTIQCACGCGEWIARYDGHGRPRLFVTGHNTGPREPQRKFLESVGDGASRSEISKRIGKSLAAVQCMAARLINEGKLIRKGRGIYGRKI